jgi:hypothetical protein
VFHILAKQQQRERESTFQCCVPVYFNAALNCIIMAALKKTKKTGYNLWAFDPSGFDKGMQM